MPTEIIAPLSSQYSASLGAELRRAAAEVPQQVFIRMLSGEWTYSEFDLETDRVAAGLLALGIGRGDKVSLMLPNCIEFAAVWFGLAKIGAVTAPVNTSFKGKVLADAINLVESSLLVVHPCGYASLHEVLSDLTTRPRWSSKGRLPEPALQTPTRRNALGSLQLVVYSPGLPCHAGQLQSLSGFAIQLIDDR